MLQTTTPRIPRRTTRRVGRPSTHRLAARCVCCVVLATAAPSPQHACSFVGPTFGAITPTADGFGWVVNARWDGTPAGLANADWGHPPFGAYWLTVAGPDQEPVAQHVAAPTEIEGHPDLLRVMADGSAWWSVGCRPPDEPPRVAVCGSLVLAGADGSPRGRLSALEDAVVLRLLDDGTAIALRVEGDALSLWRGEPVALSSWREPADTSRWSADWRVRQANPPLDGWTRLWIAKLPFTNARGRGRPAIALDHSLSMLAVVASTWEDVRVGVFDIEGMDTPSTTADDRLRARFDRTFPHARDGLPTTPTGELALATPWALAVSRSGDLALGNWAIHADCSTARPHGVLIFDETGDLSADVRTSDGRPSTDHLTFDASGRLWTAGSFITVFDRNGSHLADVPATPNEWEVRRNELEEAVCALDERSSAEEWARLWELYSADECRHPANRREAGKAKIVDAWPRLEDALPDSLWFSGIGQRVCEVYPDAAAAAAGRRLQTARTHTQRLFWMRFLPTCTKVASEPALALAKDWLESRDREMREIAQAALEAWGVETGERERLWQQAVESLGSDDRRVRLQGAEATSELLPSFAADRDDFEQRLLRGHAGQRAVAREVLRSALFRSWHENVAAEEAELRAALLTAATNWLAQADEELREIAGLLLLANDAWPVQANGTSPLDPASSLRSALAAGGDRSFWATLALSRLLHARSIRAAGPRFRLLYPTPEELGLPREIVSRLLLDSRRAARIQRTDRLRSRDELLSQIEWARQALLRSLGDDGRSQLREIVRRAPAPAPDRDSFLPEFWEMVTWMSEDLEPWTDADIALALDRFEEDPTTGWQAGPLLDAVEHAFPEDHPLDAQARRIFRDHLDEAIEIARSQREADSEDPRPRRFTRADLFPQMISHLSYNDETGRVSALLTEAKPDDVRTLVGGDPDQLPQWLGLMSVTGPWPEIVPELERRLQGNTRLLAAQVLSHTHHPAALDVLIEAQHGLYENPGVVQALARYGDAATRPLAERILENPGGYAADRGVALLVGLLLDQEALRHGLRASLARPSDRSPTEFSDQLRAATHDKVGASIAEGTWPKLADVVLLSMLEGSGIAIVLEAVERNTLSLDGAPGFVRSAPYAEQRWWFESLSELVRDETAPRRDATLRVLRAIAADGFAEAIAILEETEP